MTELLNKIRELKLNYEARIERALPTAAERITEWYEHEMYHLLRKLADAENTNLKEAMNMVIAAKKDWDD